MPKFEIELSAMAVVEARVEVEASTKEEAIEIAKQEAIWRYCGVEDSTIEADITESSD